MTEQNLWFAFSSSEWPVLSSVLGPSSLCPKVDKNWKEKLIIEWEKSQVILALESQNLWGKVVRMGAFLDFLKF